MIDKQRKLRAARKRLQTQRPRSGEKIEHARAGKGIAIGVDKNIEQRLAQPISRGPDRLGFRSSEHAPAQSPSHNAHQRRFLWPRRRRFSRRARSGSPTWSDCERLFFRELDLSPGRSLCRGGL
jgi:hypothetical protein